MSSIDIDEVNLALGFATYDNVIRYRERLVRAQIGIEASRCLDLLSDYQSLLIYAYGCFCDCKRMLENVLVRLVMTTRGKDSRFNWINGFKEFSVFTEDGASPNRQNRLSADSFVESKRQAINAFCSEGRTEGGAGCVACLDRMLLLENEIMAACESSLKTARYYESASKAILGSRLVSLLRQLSLFSDKKSASYVEMHDFPQQKCAFRQNPFTYLFFKRLMAESVMVPQSKGSVVKRADIKVGLVSDEFAYLNYKDYVQVLPVNMGNREALFASGLDVLLCTSCWNGIAVDADRAVTLMDFDGDEGVVNLQTIVRGAKEAGIPTVFQSFEDPPSYERFLPVAQAADGVFTTAEECIADYERDSEVESVGQIGFGVNPLIHNPLGITRRYAFSRTSQRVLFAGAWYEKFEQRCIDTRMIFDGVIECENTQFICIDRNLGLDDPLRTFPLKYNAFLCEPVGYEALQALVKEFDWVLNLNSVTTSSTMCARRVYELQAAGALVISNYSEAVSRLFPNVFTVFSSDEVERIINGYTEDEKLSIQIEQARDALSNHTNAHRLGCMLESVGISLPSFAPTVLILCDMRDEKILSDIAFQTYERYELADKSKAGERLGDASFFVIEWDRPYGNPYYLEDLVNVFKFADVDYACYESRENLASAYDYVRGEPAPTGALRLVKEGRCGLEVFDDSAKVGFSVLAEEWGRDTAQCEKELAVIVPYHGEFDAFHKRMFRSLLRSSCYSGMSVYVVECRAEDERPDRDILEYLYCDYDNVWFVSDRDDALALIEEDYVAFLTPYCESVGDGLRQMMTWAKSARADIIGADWRHAGDAKGVEVGDASVCSSLLRRELLPRDLILDRIVPAARISNILSRDRVSDILHMEKVVMIDYGSNNASCGM